MRFLLCAFGMLASAIQAADIPTASVDVAPLIRSTVMVLNSRNNELESTGSGFVVRLDGGTALIATNAHVVGARAETGRSMSVVFDSGRSSQREVKATIAGLDEERDLAFLAIPAAGCPQPLAMRVEKARETLIVRACGFPFGELLAIGHHHPALSITTGNVTGMISDQHGDLEYVQVDMDINPGNSGGPIVDEQGHVVGVATAKVNGTGLGFAIPAARIDEELAGRPVALALIATTTNRERGFVNADLTVMDPLRALSVIELLWTTQVDPWPEQLRPERGAWAQAQPGMTPLVLERKGDLCQGQIIARPGTWLLAQVKCKRRDGSIYFSAPVAAQVKPAEEAAKTGAKPGDDWIGGANNSPGQGRPTISTTQRDLCGESWSDGGTETTVLNVDTTAVRGGSGWSANGRFLYLLTNDGTVERIAWPDGALQGSVPYGGRARQIGMSSAGLVVALVLPFELVVLDPATLQERRRVPLADFGCLATTNGSQFAFVARENALIQVDLVSGKATAPMPIKDLLMHTNKPPMYAEREVSLRCGSALSPDGAHLIITTPSGRILEFHAGTEMEPERVSSDPNFDFTQHLYLPQDCGYAVRIMNPDECRRVGTFSLDQLALYRLDNLEKAALVLDPGGERATCVSGDCAHGGFLVATWAQLPVIHRFSEAGAPLNAFPIARQERFEKAGTHIVCVRSPPKGSDLLVITDVATLRVRPPK